MSIDYSLIVNVVISSMKEFLKVFLDLQIDENNPQAIG